MNKTEHTSIFLFFNLSKNIVEILLFIACFIIRKIFLVQFITPKCQVKMVYYVIIIFYMTLKCTRNMEHSTAISKPDTDPLRNRTLIFSYSPTRA